MYVRVYLVGWMKAIMGAVIKSPLPQGAAADADDDASEDRDTWPEAGLRDSQGHPLAEVRIDLTGSPKELDDRAQNLLLAIEREIRNQTAGWDCSVRVTPVPKS